MPRRMSPAACAYVSSELSATVGAGSGDGSGSSGGVSVAADRRGDGDWLLGCGDGARGAAWLVSACKSPLLPSFLLPPWCPPLLRGEWYDWSMLRTDGVSRAFLRSLVGLKTQERNKMNFVSWIIGESTKCADMLDKFATRTASEEKFWDCLYDPLREYPPGSRQVIRCNKTH